MHVPGATSGTFDTTACRFKNPGEYDGPRGVASAPGGAVAFGRTSPSMLARLAEHTVDAGRPQPVDALEDADGLCTV
jgi:hypothetical protein